MKTMNSIKKSIVLLAMVSFIPAMSYAETGNSDAQSLEKSSAIETEAKDWRSGDKSKLKIVSLSTSPLSNAYTAPTAFSFNLQRTSDNH
jgi:hypothetical protein